MPQQPARAPQETPDKTPRDTYQPPHLTRLGTWKALTLQISAPVLPGRTKTMNGIDHFDV